MGWEAWTTLGVLGGVVGMLALTRYAPDLILLAAVTILLLLGILEPAQALAGLANEGLVAVGVLFVVAAGVRETGAMDWVIQHVLGRPKSLWQAQTRIVGPVALMSAFMNNTPLVAMLMPVIIDWAKKQRLAASKLLIPLSYAAILGGTCTLIGTSTNLVVNGLLISQTSLPRLGLFEIAWVGLPVTLLGLGYLVGVSRWLLPDRRTLTSKLEDVREYTVEMLVEPASPLVGRTIEEAGLRHLPGMYLMEIDRDGQVIAAVGPQERLQAHDRLVFVGIVESVVDLQKIRGLTPATEQVFKLNSPRPDRCLVEAVVSNTCPLVGQTVREGRFRSVYNAAVIAVARNGERVQKKIGDITLRAGDTLLLEAHPSLVDQQRNSRDFFLVSRVEDSSPRRHDKSWLALAILGGMVIAVTTGLLPLVVAAMVAAGLMIVFRCCSGGEARRSVDWQVLLVIAAAFALGRAMQTSGAAPQVADALLQVAGDSPWLALAVIYLVTMLFTEMMTNNAAAVLVFPIALATADRLGVNFMPFAITIMMAASASFATPIGYQTNLMVYGPGGYRFTDFTRAGLPLNVLSGIVTVILAPMIWPFTV